MLALQSYEQSNGFSVLTSDELYYVNGGSVTASQVWTGVAIVASIGAAIATGGASLWLTAVACGASASALVADVTGN